MKTTKKQSRFLGWLLATTRKLTRRHDTPTWDRLRNEPSAIHPIRPEPTNGEKQKKPSKMSIRDLMDQDKNRRILSDEMQTELFNAMESAKRAMHRVSASHLAAAQVIEGKHLNEPAKQYERRIHALEAENTDLKQRIAFARQELREMRDVDITALFGEEDPASDKSWQ